MLEVGSNIGIDAGSYGGSGGREGRGPGRRTRAADGRSTFKQTIDQNAVTEMPLNGRQMTALITLSGGASKAPAGDFTGSKYSYQTISVSIAGGGGNTTLWRLDGGDNQDYMANGNLPYPFPDAVSQFSVESTALGAQDGGHVGGMVNVVTRSGTNQFHGTAFEFIRNNYINATNFYSSDAGLPSPEPVSAAPLAGRSSATSCLPSPDISGLTTRRSKATRTQSFPPLPTERRLFSH